jgi:ERF superfamily
MKVYKKLSDARIKLQGTELTKSGHNKFAGYKYFELGDFLPAVQSIFNEVGLVDAISFTEDLATMVVYDVEDGSSVTFTSPMGSANLKGCHEVQNIGAVETYQRRYLYVTALSIVEHDALDAVTGSAPVEPKKVEVKKPDVRVDAEPNPNDVAMIETLIIFGESCETLSELTGAWKQNQRHIDSIKASNKELFNKLQSKFAEYKAKFKEE